MKKNFTLFLITFLITTQKINAQLDMAFISHFSVTSDNSIQRLNWTITNNQGANTFYMERCLNGNDFKTITTVMATEKLGTESYTYSDTTTRAERVMYRLRIVSKNHHTFYSRILITQPKTASETSIKLLGNPVKDNISFNYTSKNERQAELRIYNVCGKILLTQTIKSFSGNNSVNIPLTAVFSPGMYIIELQNSFQKLTATFIKQ
jgi:pyruvate formate-lyase activating enzyme-like uncharacterized protein